MQPKEIRDMNDVEILSKLDSFKEELFNLRFQQATGQIQNPLQLREVRRNIARLKTIMNERTRTKQG
jgi:large subunit ribosomal protein L29